MVDYSDPAVRLKSFSEATHGRWPHTSTSLTPERMSGAGLYFCPEKKYPDLVRCFKCGGRLANFEPTDDPVSDHKSNYPNCTLSLSSSEVTAASSVGAVQTQLAQCSLTELPPGWKEAKSPNGKPYYWNTTTMETSWERPVDSPAGSSTAAPTSSAQVATVGLSKNLKKTKVTFYFTSLRSFT